MYALAKYEDLQKAMADVVSKISVAGCNFEKFTEFDYFIDETLRLWPPAALLGRESAQTSEVNGETIKQGVCTTKLFISVD